MIPKQVASEIMKKKKHLSPMNAALTLYSMAAVGFYDQEFYEAVMLQFKDKPKTLNDLGYLAQSCAIGRLHQYTVIFIDLFN